MAPKRRILVFDREFSITEGFTDVQAVTLLSKVDFRAESPGGCWEWTQYINDMGYGVTSVSGKPTVAHRIIYHLLNEGVSPDLHLHHRCENRRCVNPDHLQPVTPLEHLALTPQAITHMLAGRTHCNRGHEYTPDNLMTSPNGRRRCKTCARDWQNRKNALAREARGPRPVQTHCANGHEYTEENTYLYKGVRFCRTCHNLKTTALYHEKKAEVKQAVERGEVPVTLAPIEKSETHCKRGHLLPDRGNQPSNPNRRICLVCSSLRTRLGQYRKKGNLSKVAEIEALLA
jgi:hypothetical protein